MLNNLLPPKHYVLTSLSTYTKKMALYQPTFERNLSNHKFFLKGVILIDVLVASGWWSAVFSLGSSFAWCLFFTCDVVLYTHQPSGKDRFPGAASWQYIELWIADH